jgi:uncharacterized membrane protein YhaH (DUF805 family)
MAGSVPPSLSPPGAPPVTPVLGVAEALFGFNGRLTRTQYWTVWAFAVAAGAFVLRPALMGGLAPGPTNALLTLAYLAFTWIEVATTAKRARDAGLSPWLGLVSMVPALGEVWVIGIGLLPSDLWRGRPPSAPRRTPDPN